MKVNKPRIQEMTDEQLVDFLQFKKPVYELEGQDYLIATLASRLKSANDLNENQECEIEQMKHAVEETKHYLAQTQETLRQVRTELNDLKVTKVQSY